MSNIINLNSYRRASEAHTEPLDKNRVQPTSIHCNRCQGTNMAITDVINNMMTVRCSNCGNLQTYDTKTTKLR